MSGRSSRHVPKKTLSWNVDDNAFCRHTFWKSPRSFQASSADINYVGSFSFAMAPCKRLLDAIGYDAALLTAFPNRDVLLCNFVADNMLPPLPTTNTPHLKISLPLWRQIGSNTPCGCPRRHYRNPLAAGASTGAVGVLYNSSCLFLVHLTPMVT